MLGSISIAKAEAEKGEIPPVSVGDGDLEKENRSRLSHILEVDTIDRKLDSLNGRLLTKRAITVNAPAPWWLHRIIGETVCHCVEDSTVDGANKSMEMVTRNVTLKDFVSVEEKIEQRCVEKFQ